jgi:hypothetical protein
VCSDSTTDDVEYCGDLIDDDCDGFMGCADLDDCSGSYFCGDVRIEPDFIDIGPIKVGSTHVVEFKLVNSGTIDQWIYHVTMVSVAPSGAPEGIWDPQIDLDMTDSCPALPFDLAAEGGNCKVFVKFSPQEDLIYHASLKAFYNTEPAPLPSNLGWAEVVGEGVADTSSVPTVNNTTSGCSCSLSGFRFWWEGDPTADSTSLPFRLWTLPMEEKAANLIYI